MSHIGIDSIAARSPGSGDLKNAGYRFREIRPLDCDIRPNTTDDGHSARIDQSIAYMKAHLSESLRVATLARIAGVSLPHYFALFKHRTGQSPLVYFIRLRMEHAGRLLVTTTFSVKEIADQMGYEDQFYFSRIFKSVTGMSPTDYRGMIATLQGKSDLAHADEAASCRPAYASAGRDIRQQAFTIQQLSY